MTTVNYNKYGLFLQFGLIALGILFFFGYAIWNIEDLERIAMWFLATSFGMSLVVIFDKRITTSISISKEEIKK